MATVQELKDQLEAERQLFSELSEKSLGAIDTVLNAANFWLASISVVIGILALVGIGAVWFGARNMAKTVAEKRLKTYIDSDEGKSFVQRAVEAEVKRQLADTVFVNIAPPQAVPDAQGGAFKRSPGKEGVA